MDGVQVKNIEELETGCLYVATNKEKFKRCKYFTPEEFGIAARPFRKTQSADDEAGFSKQSTFKIHKFLTHSCFQLQIVIFIKVFT